MLTKHQRSLLIWFYNNKTSCTIDFGNVLSAHGDITGDTFDENEECDKNLQTLIEKGLVIKEPQPLDCFFHITEKGIKHLDDTIETTLLFQCDSCGDMWSPNIEDPMLLDAYLLEHPDGNVSIEMCESCETEREAWHNLKDAAHDINEGLQDLENLHQDFIANSLKRDHKNLK